MIRILLAEKDLDIRSSIKQIVAEFPGIDITGEVSDQDMLLKLLNEHPFDIMLLDSGLSKKGVKFFLEIKKQFQSLPVIVMSMHKESQFLESYFAGGVSGYLIKTELSEELIDAVRLVLRGEKYTSAGVMQK